MKRLLLVLILGFFSFASNAFAYDDCVPYNKDTNPNPVLPCSYNGYDYDSLAVEVGGYVMILPRFGGHTVRLP